MQFKTMVVKDVERGDALKLAATSLDLQRLQSTGRQRSGRRKLVLSKREAARLLGIDRSTTLNELIARGVLKTVLVNGHIKVTRAEVDRVAAAGFDVTRPAPATPRRQAKSKSASSESPSKEILRIRL